jgi:serine/threonine protein kinase
MTIVGRYELVGVAGRGGMAIVFVARQPGLDRQIALKQLSALHVGDPALTARFLRESQMAGSLAHPNIVTVHDYFEHDGVPYIAMEYLPRGSLRKHVGKLSLAQVAAVLEGCLAGLEHAEKKGVVHRDMKPENILITEDGGIKIADYGIAKALNMTVNEEMRTATGMAIGTPSYMAPEQAMGQAVDARTDLYALGVIAFDLIAGRPPFKIEAADTPLALMFKHINEPPPLLSDLVPGTDPRLEAWVAKLMAKKPEDRPQNAREARDALEEVIVGVLGPLWRRDSALPISGPPPAPGPLPHTPLPQTVVAQTPAPAIQAPTPAPAPAPPAGPASSVPRPKTRSRRRPGVAAAAAGLVAVAAIAGIAIVALGSSGSNGASTASLKPCLQRFLDGTSVDEPVLIGLTNRFPLIADGRPVGLILKAGRTLAVFRFVYVPGPTAYFEIVGARDAETCRLVRMRDVTNVGSLPNATPWDTIVLALRRGQFGLRLGTPSSTQFEADLRRGTT